MTDKMRVGEVVEASTSEFVAQCYEVNQAPALGSLLKVKSGEIDIYAVLQSSTTSSIESGRYPLARGKDMAEETEIYKANPQLLKLMRTLFSAQVLGYSRNAKIYQRFPPYSPHLHSFVYLCEKEEVLEFSKSYDFLNLLLSYDAKADQVVAACLRQMAKVHPSPNSFLTGAGKCLVKKLGREVERLNYLLRSLKD